MLRCGRASVYDPGVRGPEPLSTGSGPAPRSALTEVRNVVVANEIQHSPAAQVVLGQALLGEALHGVEAAALLGGEQQLSLDAPPDTPTCIRRWSESSSIVGVRFERDYLHPEMSRLLAESARRLPEHLDLTERAAANWLQLVRSLSADSAADQHPLVREQLSGAITTAFVSHAHVQMDMHWTFHLSPLFPFG